MITKKELRNLVLVFMIGVLFILALCWNAKQYDKTQPYQKYINIQTEQ